MKYNEKQFYQSITEPIETQEMSNGSKIDLHYMNDEPFFMDNINKSRFSVWASGDGKNYKLFVEKGLYDETSELYTKDVNEIWMEFWAKIDRMKKRYLLFVLLPILLVLAAAFILISIFAPNNVWLLVGVVGVIIVGSLFASSFLNRKMQVENLNAANRIRDKIGLERFKQILEAQDAYITKFYDDLQAKYEEEDRLVEEAENLDEIEAIANDKIVSDEELEANKEIATEDTQKDDTKEE
ncbi:MAG: hypothetical protein K6E24_02905 [bacterium]|nr:hypothetical protein [bacterium]